MPIRIYLKQAPTPVEGTTELKIAMDDYGLYYASNEYLDLFTLPPAILPENVSRVSWQGCPHNLKPGYFPTAEYRHGNTIGLYTYDSMRPNLRFSSLTLAEAQEYVRLFQSGFLSPYVPPVVVAAPIASRNSPNRFLHALRVLLGKK